MKKGLVLIFLVLVPFVIADWPMAGHDNQRTSYAPEDPISPTKNPVWSKSFDSYIPNRAHIITVDRGSSGSMVYVPTEDGVYALNPDSGNQIWFYPTSQPVGHSPTVVNDIMYIPVLDKTIHFVNAVSGNKITQTDSAGAGYVTSPLVANGLVYATNLDGYVYAFRTDNAQLKWHFKTDHTISFSPTLSPDEKTLYVVSNDMHIYALNALTGVQKARSRGLHGDVLDSFWPVYNEQYDLLLVPVTLNFPFGYMIKYQRHEATYNGVPLLYIKSSLTGVNTIDGTRFQNWLREDPQRQSLLVFDANLNEKTSTSFTPPFLYWGNTLSQRYPPIVDGIGRVWSTTPWHDGSYFGGGRYAGWTPGTHNFIPKPAATSGTESADEPEALSLLGDVIYHNDGGDGVDKGGATSISGGGGAFWYINDYYKWFGNVWEKWSNFNYGNMVYLDDPSNPSWGSRTGTHGHQNPPVPLRGKVYFHRSNAVIALSP